MRVSLPASAEAHQDRILVRADASADAAELAVRRVWLDLLKLIQTGGHWSHLFTAARRTLHTLPAVASTVEQDLVAAASDAARHAAHQIAGRLTPAQRRRLAARKGVVRAPALLEDAAEAPDLLGDLAELLTGPTAHQVLAVVRAAGWPERVKALAKLADPDVLAGRIATLAQQGAGPRKIAAEIRPLVQDVQTSARRVARTASLWVAHEVELHQWEELGEMVAGYTVRAVRDRATRKEHAARDGTTYWRRPKRGQKGFKDMPRPPREADGTWAFGCRCWLEPRLVE